MRWFAEGELQATSGLDPCSVSGSETTWRVGELLGKTRSIMWFSVTVRSLWEGCCGVGRRVQQSNCFPYQCCWWNKSFSEINRLQITVRLVVSPFLIMQSFFIRTSEIVLTLYWFGSLLSLSVVFSGSNVSSFDHLIHPCPVNLLVLQLFVSLVVTSYSSNIDLEMVSPSLFLACS